jgi:RimJ/RimL family protein N-acetyltransferase
VILNQVQVIKAGNQIMFKNIVTPRLVLRRLETADSEAVHRYRTDPGVSRFQSWRPLSVEDALRFIEALAKVNPDTPGTWFQLAIILRDTGLLIGDCGLHYPAEETRQAEVGITLAQEYQGKGYALEALTAVLDYLFITLGKHRVYASVDPRNRSCLALLERLGMRKEGHFRESLWFKGEWADDVIYAILDREWRPARR